MLKMGRCLYIGVNLKQNVGEKSIKIDGGGGVRVDVNGEVKVL